jgi:hypothetical protein
MMITLKGIIDTDTINYKKISMILEFPKCDFKCDKECGRSVCQNSSIINYPDIDVEIDDIIDRYINNPLTDAIVIQGLEPFDTKSQLYSFIRYFREKSNDDIVIYTGYNEYELSNDIDDLIKKTNNIIIKFGRYIPGQEPHKDNVLGVNLASDNQYAKKIC